MQGQREVPRWLQLEARECRTLDEFREMLARHKVWMNRKAASVIFEYLHRTILLG